MLQLVTSLRLLDTAVVVFTATGCADTFAAAGDGAAGSITAVDVVDLDVCQNAAMLLITLTIVTGNVGCSHRSCGYECWILTLTLLLRHRNIL